MPSTSVTFDVGVLAFAGQRGASTGRNGLLKDCALLHAQEAINGKGKPVWEGGQNYHTRLTVRDHTGVTQFVDGYELYDSTAYETEQNTLYPLCNSGLLMKIGIAERRLLSATDGALAAKVEALAEETVSFLQRQWQYRVVTGTGVGFTNWTTLNGIDSTGGILEQDAVGSQTNIIGGLSKSTYSGVPGWQNQVANLGNAFLTNQIGLYGLLENRKVYKPINKKTIWLMTVAGRTNLKRVTQPNQMFISTNPKDTDFGVPIEIYQGIKIYTDSFLPIAGTNTTTYPMTAVLLDLEDIFFAFAPAAKDVMGSLPSGYFGMGDWGPIAGLQNVAGCPMNVNGNTVAAAIGSSGVAYAGETP